MHDPTGQIKHITTPSERQHMRDQPFRGIIRDDAPPPPMPSPGAKPHTAKLFHTADRSLSDQFHAKWLWNLARVNLQDFSHFTIGYSQRTWTQVRELLQTARVTMLIDARRNAVSQYKPAFSKTHLAAAAMAAGITYRHVPELGIASEERGDLADTHDYAELFSAYQQRLDEALLRSLLGDDLKNQRLALMCVEIDPTTCHRHRLALLLEDIGFKTLDL